MKFKLNSAANKLEYQSKEVDVKFKEDYRNTLKNTITVMDTNEMDKGW